MKSIKLLLVIAVLAAIPSLSCKKSGVASSFDKSYSAWLAYKGKTNNTYSYIAVEGDQLNYYSETTIKVVQGEIVARDYFYYLYKYTSSGGTPVKTLTTEWHETNANKDVGTHGTDAADLFTLDDVYYRAQNIWLKADIGKNVITLETNNDGMISAVGYTPNSCQSDCFIGIHIKSITN